MKIAHCLLIAYVIGKHAYILGWEDKFYAVCFFRGERSVVRKVSRGSICLRKFFRIKVQNSFYISCFLFSISILLVELFWVIVLGKYSSGSKSLEPLFSNLFRPTKHFRYLFQVTGTKLTIAGNLNLLNSIMHRL